MSFLDYSQRVDKETITLNYFLLPSWTSTSATVLLNMDNAYSMQCFPLGEAGDYWAGCRWAAGGPERLTSLSCYVKYTLVHLTSEVLTFPPSPCSMVGVIL